MCNSCVAMTVNGVLCHEHGCPNAWKAVRECAECGSPFVPENRFQECCDEQCHAAYYGLRMVDLDEIEEIQ